MLLEKTKNLTVFILHLIFFVILFDLCLLLLISGPSSFIPFRYMGY